MSFDSLSSKFFRLFVVLEGSNPPVWRRIVVNGGTPLISIHCALQTCFGWSNEHLYMFYDEILDYAPFEFDIPDAEDSNSLAIYNILNQIGETIYYEYDFGNKWVHKITLEAFVDLENFNTIPFCISGERCGPPENCGGIEDYQNILKIIADKKHKDYRETRAKIGRGWNPDRINFNKINRLLKKDEFGCKWDKFDSMS